MKTLLLTQRDIQPCLELQTLLEPFRQGFIAHSQRDRHNSASDASRMEGIPAFAGRFEHALEPQLRGAVFLFGLADKTPLAVMDASALHSIRAGLAGAVAADALARKDAQHVAVIGAGERNLWALRALLCVRNVRHISVFDPTPFISGRFVRELANETDAKILVSSNLSEALLEADLVLCATSVREPLLYDGMLDPGTHVNSLGADSVGKAELSLDLLEAARFFPDDRDLALSVDALEGVGGDSSLITAELGEVLGGQAAGRLSNDDITIYSGVGLAWQDTLVAWHVYERAKAAGVGEGVDLPIGFGWH